MALVVFGAIECPPFVFTVLGFHLPSFVFIYLVSLNEDVSRSFKNCPVKKRFRNADDPAGMPLIENAVKRPC